MRTCDFSTVKPCCASAAIMSALVTEPNSLPSTPAIWAIFTVTPLSFAARAWASSSLTCSAASSSARRAANSATLASVARLALPCGIRKLRAKPFFTLTTSPNWPRFTTFSIRITCMVCSLVQIGVRQQGQEARALDGGTQLALVARLCASDARRDDLAVFGDELLKDVQVLVIHFRDLLCGEAAELAALEKLPRRTLLLVVFLLVAGYTSHDISSYSNLIFSICSISCVLRKLRCARNPSAVTCCPTCNRAACWAASSRASAVISHCTCRCIPASCCIEAWRIFISIRAIPAGV